LPISESLPEVTDRDSSGNEIIMRLVPPGEFIMGSYQGDYDEKPALTVSQDAFYMDKYEVTNALYRNCVEANVCKEPQETSQYNDEQKANHPVVYVDWNMATAYCEWRGARLPTEAEWEKAARGDDRRTYPWGEDISCKNANFSDCVKGTAAVGSYASGQSPYGIFDMSGNVWEWVNDWYNSSYYSQSSGANPTGPQSGEFRVLRGGAWGYTPSLQSVSTRFWASPLKGDDNIGFRCARDAEE